MKHAEVLAPIESKKYDLDVKDKKILGLLSINSRTPITRIAKILGYSKEAVKYRIDKLVKDGIITDFYTVIDSSRLNLMRFNIYLEFFSLAKEDENSIIDYLKAYKKISWLISTSGKWDFMIQISARDINELDQALMDISEEFGNKLKAYEVNIITQFHHVRPRFLTKDVKINLPKLKFLERSMVANKKKELKLDRLDVLILKGLEQNSRISVLDLSRQIKLSKDAIKNRIRNLTAAGIIERYMLRYNYHLLGYEYHSILLKLGNSDTEKRQKLINYLKQRSEVIAVFVQIGAWDISVQTIVKNAQELKNFIGDIKEKFRDIIKDNDSVLYFNQYLFTYLTADFLSRYEIKEVHSK